MCYKITGRYNAPCFDIVQKTSMNKIIPVTGKKVCMISMYFK